MTKESVVLITDVNFRKRDIIRYGVEELSQEYNVLIIDCSLFINGHKKYQLSEESEFLHENLRVFKDFNSINFFLGDSTFKFYVDLINTSNIKTLRLRRLLKHLRVKRVVLRLAEIPHFDNKTSKVTIILKSGNILKKIYGFIVRKLLNLLNDKADIALLAGGEAKKKHQNIAKKVISVHSMDYELHKNSLNKIENNELPPAYAVFLDQSAPNHPDYKFHNNKPPVTAEIYYDSMNKFFKVLEEKINIEVVIAKHPKSGISSDPWEGRLCLENKSSFLVSNCEFVLAHYSTAISFAVIANKPVVQLVTDQYLKSHRKDRLKGFAELLNLRVFNVDNFKEDRITKDSLMELDTARYNEYSERFLKSKESNLGSIWDSLIANEI